MENDADMAPDGIVTEGGTVALVLLELKLTTVPPTGAIVFSTTVPVAERPPVTILGLMVRVETSTGLIVRIAE